VGVRSMNTSDTVVLPVEVLSSYTALPTGSPTRANLQVRGRSREVCRAIAAVSATLAMA
jgi:hypothetical protein